MIFQTLTLLGFVLLHHFGYLNHVYNFSLCFPEEKKNDVGITYFIHCPHDNFIDYIKEMNEIFCKVTSDSIEGKIPGFNVSKLLTEEKFYQTLPIINTEDQIIGKIRLCIVWEKLNKPVARSFLMTHNDPQHDSTSDIQSLTKCKINKKKLGTHYRSKYVDISDCAKDRQKHKDNRPCSVDYKHKKKTKYAVPSPQTKGNYYTGLIEKNFLTKIKQNLIICS